MSDGTHSHPVEPDPFFFLAATTRSGTTLLGLMLGHHPELCFPGEFVFALDAAQGLDVRRAEDLARYRERLALDRHARALEFRCDPTLDFEELLCSILQRMRDRSRNPGGPVLGVAVHRHFALAADLFSDARFLHMVRDPRDVAASWLEHGWKGNGFAAGREWSRLEREWDRLAARLPKARFLELRYEELVADPPKVLSRICEFLDVPYSASMLAYPEDTSYEPVDPSQATKWQRRLPSRQVRLLEAAVGKLLEERHYTASGLPVLRIGRLREVLLSIDDRLRQVRARIRRFGFRWWVSSRIARSLGLKSWANQLELRAQAIIHTQLK